MSNIEHFGGFSVVSGDIKIDVSLDRFSEQFRDAQYELDGNIMNSMIPFMPMDTGMLIDTTRAKSASVQGDGIVYAAFSPYGRFQYMGYVMIGEVSKIAWARLGERKILTDKPLRYQKKGAKSFWFEVAKRADGAKWIKQAKRTAGGGSG